jgi:hypothetical protein
LARTLGHLMFARRFLAEARGHYVRAAELEPDHVRAARDLWSAAGVAQVETNGQLRYEYVVEAAERAAAAGDRGLQSEVLAEAVSVATRFPAMFEREIGTQELAGLLAQAQAAAPPDDLRATAQLTIADAWTNTRMVDVPEISIFTAAVDVAEQAGDPLLVSAALDALGSAQVMAGHLTLTHELGARRLELITRMAAHQPRAGAEIYDILHMAVENAISAGEVSFALETAHRFGDDELVAAAPLMIDSKPIVALVLLGRFDEAIARGERVRRAWVDSGRPAARWLAPSLYSLVLCHALRGDDAAAADWRTFAGTELAGEQTRNVHFRVGGMIDFVERRLALHFGQPSTAVPALQSSPAADSWWQVRHWYFDAYPWAAAAELAVATARPDASAWLHAARPAAQENLWAAAVIARARGRFTGDQADIARALTGFEQLGARYEHACTLALVPGRSDEAHRELERLGVRRPAVGG